jgi:4-azaleucine resistance transporter AzlC
MPRREFLNGIRDTLPLILGAIPFGIIFGAVAISSGLPAWAAITMSLLVFAGSSQFIAVGLVAQDVSIVLIVLTTFVVNLRHALYSLSLGPYLKNLSQRWLAPLAFWLTDETYAVTIGRFMRAGESPHKHWYMLGSAVAMYTNWQICTVIGVYIGSHVENAAEWGLDFAMIVTFIGIAVPLIRTRPMLVCAVAAGISALVLYDLPSKLGLIAAAVIGIAAGLISEELTAPKPVEVPCTD